MKNKILVQMSGAEGSFVGREILEVVEEGALVTGCRFQVFCNCNCDWDSILAACG